MTRCQNCGSDFVNAGMLSAEFDETGLCFNCYNEKKEPNGCHHITLSKIADPEADHTSQEWWNWACDDCPMVFDAKIINIPLSKNEQERLDMFTNMMEQNKKRKRI